MDPNIVNPPKTYLILIFGRENGGKWGIVARIPERDKTTALKECARFNKNGYARVILQNTGERILA